jgi:hypothetical protein
LDANGWDTAAAAAAAAMLLKGHIESAYQISVTAAVCVLSGCPGAYKLQQAVAATSPFSYL